MEDVTRLPIRSFWQIVSLLREINVEKVWHDGFMRNTIIGVLTVITCIYSVIGFLGSLLLLISFLSGFIVFHKVFFIYNVTVPDLTKLVSQNWSTSCTEEQHKRRQLIRQNTSDPGCKLLTKLLDKYISSWYVNICPENDPNSSHFQTELKLTIRHAASILIHRVQKLDLTNFLLYRVLPLAAKHIHTVENNSRQIKPKWHRALNNRNTELDYLRCLSRQLLPILLPPACYNCRTFYLLNQELVSGWLLLPLSDAVSNPTVLNTFLLYLLDSKSGTENTNKEDQVGEKKIVSPLHDAGDEESEDTSVEAAAHGSNPISNEEDSSPTQSEHVQLLSTFVPRCESKSDLWHPNLEAILKDQSLLFAFMQYLKSQADINVLQFCLDVEEFNSRMLAPDLSPDDLDILYKDAWDIYSIYFRLERLHVSNFHKSEEFFNHLCGPKISSSNTTSGLSSPESLDSPLKRKKSPDGPVAKLSNRLQKITGVLKPNVVLEGQKDVADSILPEVEVELAETVKESDSEERDLSKWKVSVFNSRVKSNPNFTVKVVRTDLPPHDPDAEWSVARKIQDFYTLETKLTEFHGNFSDVQLPAKKLLVPCPDDSRVYEIYLRTILSKPGLKGSDLLFAFLKAPTFEVEQFALSRLFKKSVPGITLKKERGQHLDLFIRNFLDSTKTKASKIEWKDISEELKPRHVVNMRSKVFGNNLDIPPQGETIDNIGLQYSTTMETRVLDGPAKCLLFIGIKSYKLARSIVRLIFALLTLFKSTLDSLIYMFVTKTLNTSLSSDNIAYLVYCLDWSLFENTVSVDPKQMKDSVEAKIGQSSALLRPLLNKCFVTLQDPLLNKQLFYQIFEEVLAEIFPELLHPISTSSISSQPSDTGN
uniref:Sorting nexin-14 n=1 Tax=Cacopsylla melanoneura TaxID=428564 RepID=A0A8D8RT95_9HEMI